jgi:hypothetical protein
MPDECAG